jgi:prepilin-type N-terminal cleavage/methylation domain-containing protein
MRQANQTHSDGFTLLELVISLTIISGIALLIYTTPQYWGASAAHGEVRSMENQRARAALALITSSEIRLSLSLQGEEGTFVYFSASRKS